MRLTPIGITALQGIFTIVFAPNYRISITIKNNGRILIKLILSVIRYGNNGNSKT
jgi:hypothetical protein